MVKAKFAQVPLDVYAEYAAYLAPQSLELFMRKRKEVSAAVLIQYHFRRWKRRRSQDELNRLLMYRILVRWTKRVFVFKSAAKVCAVCRSFIARNLLLFLREEQAVKTPTQTVEYSQRTSPTKGPPGLSPKDVRVDSPDRRTISISPFSPKGASNVDSVGRRALSVSPVKKIKRNVVFSPHSDSSSSHLESNHTPTPVLEEDSEESPSVPANNDDMKQKILLRLVIDLQSLFRGRKARRLVSKLRQERELKRSIESKMEALKSAVFASAEERARIASGRTKNVKRTESPEITEYVNSPSPLARQRTRMGKTREWDLDDEPVPVLATMILITPSGLRIEYPENGERALNLLKAKLLSYTSQTTLLRLEANALVSQAARAVDPNDKADGIYEGEQRTIKISPFNIIVPQDIDGLLAHGTVVDTASPLHGAKLAGTGWEVAEVNDEEVYELRPVQVIRAAMRIQRVFRRFLTKRKFLAYLEEKDLDQVREEERAEPEEDDAEPVVHQTDTVNTDACVIS